jgi:hypothetical protein
VSARRLVVAGALAAALSAPAREAAAQSRGVYPAGISATNAGVTPEPGVSFVVLPLYYERDRMTGASGETVATGLHSVLLDMNTLIWASGTTMAWLGGARFSAAATIPVAQNSLTSDTAGRISGGAGLGDSYYQPLILGWRLPRADIRLIYGFLAPTGRFRADTNDNVGSGYWTHALSSGQTFYLTGDRATALSVFEMLELHTTQEGTGIRPGDTVNLDYSLTRLFPLPNGLRLQFGLAGYGQWQTSAKTGRAVTVADSATRYRVNALGFASNLLVPARKLSVGLKFFKEFDTRSTFEGYSLQGAFALKF